MMTSVSKTNKILLVDDEEDIREVLGITLEDMGYEVFTAENGHKALKLFECNTFPLVLTDIKMPGMDGIELLKKIKTISPLTEIIMITGHGDMDLAIESFRNQAVEFITKPVDVETLEAALKRAWEKIKIKNGIKEYTENLEQLILEKTRALDETKTALLTRSEKKDHITSIMENLPLVVFIIDKAFKITAANNVFKKKFGNIENMTEAVCYELCKKSHVPCPDCPAVKTFENGATHQREITYSTEDGDKIPFLSWSSPAVYDRNKEVAEVIIMATDISQVIDIEDHLTSLGLMIGSVSHGIKGLLTGLDGGVYVLDSALKKQNQDKAEEGLEMVREMTCKIKKMILDILFYAKERELQKEKISAREFGLDLIKVIKPRTEKNQINLRQNLPLEDFVFEADAGVLHAALMNIFENAVDACIADTAKEKHEIYFKTSLSENGDEVKFIISDNGIGMEQCEMEKAFTLFHSGKGKKGTGLGLFISKKSIKQHGGSISVQSQQDKGTTFEIILPLNIKTD